MLIFIHVVKDFVLELQKGDIMSGLVRLEILGQKILNVSPNLGFTKSSLNYLPNDKL